MSELEFSKESLEHFLNQAQLSANVRADRMYPDDCKEKRHYIETKTAELYNRMIGNWP